MKALKSVPVPPVTTALVAPKDAEIAPLAREDDQNINVIALLLADKRSTATKKAYEADLRHFFGENPTPAVAQSFLSLSPPRVAERLALYKGKMLAGGLSEATVNRRLSAVRSLLKFAYRLGLSQTSGAKLVDSEKVKAYRDTRGIDPKLIQKLIAQPGTDSLHGLRDTAILRLLFENGLRRGEVARERERPGLRVKDFQAKERRLWVRGKGRGTQRESVTLSPRCVGAISAYLSLAGHADDADGPLFRNLCHRPDEAGREISTEAVYEIVREYGRKIDIPNLAPHKLRHSAITEALERTNGNVRIVRDFSRHANINTILHYDDKRGDGQGEVTMLLSKGT